MIKMRTVEIAVGALIIAGIASLLMLALQVSGLTTLFKTENGYKVDAHFENIGGLKVRAKVSVAGVVVGRVTAITLDPQSFNAKVTLFLENGRCDKFPSDTQASILTTGLLGDNYITLTPGFNEEEHLKAGSVIPVENTHSALILEKLISRFLANQVSSDKTGTGNKENITIEGLEPSQQKISSPESVDRTEKVPLKVEENIEKKPDSMPTPSMEKQIEH